MNTGSCSISFPLIDRHGDRDLSDRHGDRDLSDLQMKFKFAINSIIYTRFILRFTVA